MTHFRHSLLVATTLAWALAHPVSADIDQTSLKDIARDAQVLRESGVDAFEETFLPPSDDDILRIAEEVLEGTQTKAEKAIDAELEHRGIEVPEMGDSYALSGDWIDILISRSLGRTEIEQMIASATASPVPVRFVLRGIEEGQRINDAMLDYGYWSRDIDDPPEGILDPTIFQDRNVESVPAMFYMRDGEVIASVDGLSNTAWLIEAVERGETGHLGTEGPVLAISERDLIEVMQERTAALDLESRKEQTIATYWERATFTALSPAVEAATRLIDPTFIVNQPIPDANGNVLVEAGTRINPLDMQPFTLRLIVFNPTREEEVDWALSLDPLAGKQDMLIATEMNRQAGWDGFEALEDTFDAPVYMLQPDVRRQFQLRRTPSLVTASRDQFIVEELFVAPSVSDTNNTESR